MYCTHVISPYQLSPMNLILDRVGWEFKTCLGGVEWLGSYVTGEKFESRCQVLAAEYTWLFQVWRRNISIPENIPTRQVSKFPSYQGKVQILHL